MEIYPLRDVAAWWNAIDLGAPPTEIQEFQLSKLVADDLDFWLAAELAVVSTSRSHDLELEPTSTALVTGILGTNLMELTPIRFQLDGSIDYEAWIRSCTLVRDQLHEIGAKSNDSEEPQPLPTPFAVAAEVICERSQAGLATLVDGSAAAAAALCAYGRDASIVNYVRFLSYSSSPISTKVAEYLRIPALVPFVVSRSDSTVHQLALETINAAVNNAENLRLELLEGLNPQTEA